MEEEGYRLRYSGNLVFLWLKTRGTEPIQILVPSTWGLATIRSFWHHLTSPVPSKKIKKVIEEYPIQLFCVKWSNFNNLFALIETLRNCT
jgi:hypothetical protein